MSGHVITVKELIRHQLLKRLCLCAIQGGYLGCWSSDSLILDFIATNRTGCWRLDMDHELEKFHRNSSDIFYFPGSSKLRGPKTKWVDVTHPCRYSVTKWMIWRSSVGRLI